LKRTVLIAETVREQRDDESGREGEGTFNPTQLVQPHTPP